MTTRLPEGTAERVRQYARRRRRSVNETVAVAIEEWLRRIPEFRLADDAEVTWAGGQVRGPRNVPVVF